LWEAISCRFVVRGKEEVSVVVVEGKDLRMGREREEGRSEAREFSFDFLSRLRLLHTRREMERYRSKNTHPLFSNISDILLQSPCC